MQKYEAPIKDIEYLFNSVFNIKKYSNLDRFKKINPETTSMILDEASKFGAQTLTRPEELSGDSVFTEPVMDHALSKYTLNSDDIIVLLQPTSPLRYKSTLNRCIQSIKNKGFDSSLTVKKIHLFRWKKVQNSFFHLNKWIFLTVKEESNP